MFDAKNYWNERLKTNYNLNGVGDISLTLNYNKWSYAVTCSILKKLFKKYVTIDGNKNVLDIGSGTGFVIKIWKEFGVNISGIDISETAIINLRKQFPGSQFFECDVGSDDLPFNDNYFSACTAASVLYHIVDDEFLANAIRSIHRVLKKDGIFIFSDNFPHRNNMKIIHQNCRTLEVYESILKRNSFKIIDRVPNYVLFNDPVDANSKYYTYFWSMITRLAKKWKGFDSIIWPLLYPIEIFLTANLKESPAQEFMICRAIKD